MPTRCISDWNCGLCVFDDSLWLPCLLAGCHGLLFLLELWEDVVGSGLHGCWADVSGILPLELPAMWAYNCEVWWVWKVKLCVLSLALECAVGVAE